jgi:hypothetical protein
MCRLWTSTLKSVQVLSFSEWVLQRFFKTLHYHCMDWCYERHCVSMGTMWSSESNKFFYGNKDLKTVGLLTHYSIRCEIWHYRLPYLNHCKPCTCILCVHSKTYLHLKCLWEAEDLNTKLRKILSGRNLTLRLLTWDWSLKFKVKWEKTLHVGTLNRGFPVASVTCLNSTLNYH